MRKILVCLIVAASAVFAAQTRSSNEMVSVPTSAPINLANKQFEDALAMYRVSDFKEAARLFNLACEGGHARACYDMGAMIASGKVAAKQPETAVKFYERAYKMGDKLGSYALAYAHQTGVGVAKDEARAYELYKNACELGLAKGCNEAGYMSERGAGMQIDVKAAAKFYEKACKMGLDVGCENAKILKR
ncbi:MAG: tetratricopeptide repeat protein [Campylobacter sp.]|uniref:tetratricopeptide repeat protein n=1 Tax=Campylobacter sp. TaxID=205 RepID=UPI003614E3F6